MFKILKGNTPSYLKSIFSLAPWNVTLEIIVVNWIFQNHEQIIWSEVYVTVGQYCGNTKSSKFVTFLEGYDYYVNM